MPVVVELTRKSDGTIISGVGFKDLDDEMRKAFNAEPDDTAWFRGWYNDILFGLALGHNFTSLREVFKEEKDILELIDWLDEHFTFETWRA